MSAQKSAQPSKMVASPAADWGVELRESGGKGAGVFAARSFRAGELVLAGVIGAELDRNDAHASQIALDRFVRHDGLMPRVNHSCDPTCGVRLNEAGAHDLFARLLISSGQEITFDYAMRNYRVEHFPDSCQCGTDLCRGSITGWKDLPADRRDAYQGSIAPYLLTEHADLFQETPAQRPGL
ncbi:SET domain-containing protein-lysine N-methyltransferase [Streptomyces albipurpureus]|uniref:SET domain-containing protein-lysine N-methyltransferase n=1 Tax=Streptomyces albipurpureus TaxID=2897419 RepID=A0ABT0USC5_9ACTN|nr:SET domain-containing protein-lysine N-methyltransferase [Streptomyces sp. CWNU-1]MCM2391349.1 SET domain-containing protein-lysine N-methyltransferase [Streptomyces sp. CWNU-1]